MNLNVEISGLRIEPPLILASGIWGSTGENLRRAMKCGAGAVVTKSIGMYDRDGHTGPRFIEIDTGYLNAMGLPNPGINDFEEEIEIALRGEKPVIGSVFGSSASEFAELCLKMENYGVHAVELNMSCPHASCYGLEIGSEPKNVEKIVNKVKEKVKIPVFAKLSAMVSDFIGCVKGVEKGGADGVVLINTIRAMSINVEMGKPVLGNIFGGYSGYGIKPISIYCVYTAFKSSSIPIIGVGGIECGRDAIEYFMAGASCVQIGSAIVKYGDKTFEKIRDEIERMMEFLKVNDINALVGISHEDCSN